MPQFNDSQNVPIRQEDHVVCLKVADGQTYIYEGQVVKLACPPGLSQVQVQLPNGELGWFDRQEVTVQINDTDDRISLRQEG